MRMMALGLFIFLFGIGTATFLESIYDIQTAKLLIYNAIWFELLLVYLAISLVINIFRYKMWKREKIAMLMFHLSFIVILIGAGVTRYFSFEGVMKLPEPDPQTGILRPVDYIFSADPRIKVFIDNKYVEETVYLSEKVKPNFKVNFKFPEKNKNISVELVKFQKRHIDSLIVNDSITDYVLDIVTGGKQSNYLAPGGFMMIGDIPMSFEKKDLMPGGIEIYKINGKMMIKSGVPISYLPMAQMQKIRQSGMDAPDSLYQQIPVDSLVPFNTLNLFQVGEQSFVFKEVINHAKMMLVPSGRKDVGNDFITLRISDGTDVKEVIVEGGMSIAAKEERFTWKDQLYSIQYGSIPVRLPFQLACNSFDLLRYPGSNSPSSFESVVTVIDDKNNKTKTQKIFMNNVMDYNGYRFFQSSYFPDETGTILSVNFDWWGTNISYLGYLLMSIGMILSLFAPVGRFKELNELLKKIADKRKSIGTTVIALFVALGLNAQTAEQDYHVHADGTKHYGSHDDAPAEDYHVHEDGTIHYGSHDEPAHTHTHEHNHKHDHSQAAESTNSSINLSKPLFMSMDHAKKLATLMVQDFDGRIVPLHTVCDEIMRKVHRGSFFEYEGKKYDPVQAVMSMHITPDAWLKMPFIYVPSALRERLGTDKYASYEQLIDKNTDEFILASEYQKAHQKLDKEKNEFDKALIKLVEKFEVFNSTLMWSYLRIMPIRGHENNSWFNPIAMDVAQHEAKLYNAAGDYFNTLFKAMNANGNFAEADAKLEVLKAHQRESAGSFAVSKAKLSLETTYNRMTIFKNAQYLYLLTSLILLFAYIGRIVSNRKGERRKVAVWFERLIIGAIVLTFVYHGSGLAMRWYISGHAPWSNGYEAVVFIGWITVLVGFIFTKKNSIILPAATLLGFFMIFVTEMNILDPQITPLVPVLQSYWLMIHVAIITASYGFLGLGCILGIVNLFLYILRSRKNGQEVTWNINELTYVSEMAQTIGLFMLTIGTFLGGVWANESWGRYWGWDPKETWALVSVLVYAILLHLRFIPAFKSKFTFNVASIWAYTAILFTFFGVNFYLVGLHSYAQGDGLGEFPMGVIVAIVCFYLFTEVASWLNKRFTNPGELLPLKYFMKKAIILSISFIIIYILFVLFKVLNFAEAATVSVQTVVLFFVTNLVLFALEKLISNKK